MTSSSTRKSQAQGKEWEIVLDYVKKMPNWDIKIQGHVHVNNNFSTHVHLNTKKAAPEKLPLKQASL